MITILKNNFKAALFVFSGLIVVSCSPIKTSLVEQTEKPVTEIAIRMVKEGQKNEFLEARKNFITVLKEQDGVLADREFESFYALPTPDKREVFIGMTNYETYKTVGKVQGKMGVVSKFLTFKKTMDLKAYVFVQQTEGPTFTLNKLADGNGEVLELGIRRIKPGMEKEFHKYRKEFVEKMSTYPGVKENYEFKVVGGNDIENLTVGMSVFESQDAFMKLLEPLQQEEITQKYFSTFDIVAGQFALSTTNQ